MNNKNEIDSMNYYYSNCNTPVNIEDKICPNCGANPKEILEEKFKGDIVPVKIYVNELDAQVAISHLKSNSINAILSRDDSDTMEPYLQLTRGVRVLVKDIDFEKALEVLEAMNS